MRRSIVALLCINFFMNPVVSVLGYTAKAHANSGNPKLNRITRSVAIATNENLDRRISMAIIEHGQAIQYLSCPISQAPEISTQNCRQLTPAISTVLHDRFAAFENEMKKRFEQSVRQERERPSDETREPNYGLLFAGGILAFVGGYGAWGSAITNNQENLSTYGDYGKQHEIARLRLQRNLFAGIGVLGLGLGAAGLAARGRAEREFAEQALTAMDHVGKQPFSQRMVRAQQEFTRRSLEAGGGCVGGCSVSTNESEPKVEDRAMGQIFFNALESAICNAAQTTLVL